MNRMILSWKNYQLQLKYPFTISSYSRTYTPIVLVEIEYDGIIGYGEASLPQYLGETQESIDDFLRKVDLTRFNDPFVLDDILTYIDLLDEGNTAAKASVDIALHDLVGKLKNQPWFDIWKLNLVETPNSTYTIGIDNDETVIKKVKEVSSDFKILKVKLGGEDDRRMIEVIRSVTNLPLAIDANQGWKDKIYALDTICWLKENGAVMIEQPMSKFDLEGNAWLTQHSPLPIYADESIQRLSDLSTIKGAFSGINIKLMKCTGMSEAWKMIVESRKLNMDVMIGCMTETSCAISAAAQLSPAVKFADLDGAMLITNDCFTGMKIKKGKIVLNDLPGIGVSKID